MRKILFAIVGCAWLAQPSAGQWRKTITFQPADVINAVYFIGIPGPARIGFATGNPTWRTTDGGESWKKVTIDPNADLTGICFRDSLTGWAANQGDDLPFCYKTSNGGLSWFALPGIASAGPVCYNDSNHTLFIGIGDSGARVSRDFGATWDTIPLMNVSCFSFSSPSHGIAVTAPFYHLDIHGNPHTIDSFPHIYVTSDGGNSWVKSDQFNQVDTFQGDFLSRVLVLPNSPICFAVGPGSAFVNPDSGAWGITVYRSDDFGSTWRLVSYDPRRVYGADAVGGILDRLATSTDSGFFISTDQGVTWVFDGGPKNAYGFYCDKGKTVSGGYLDTTAFTYGLWVEDWGTAGVAAQPEQPAATISVHPNPTTGVVTLAGGIGVRTVAVENVLGEQVLRFENPVCAASGALTFNLTGLPAGLYFFRITGTSGETETVRLVKE